MVVIEIYRDIKVVSTRLGSSRSAGCLIRRPRTLIFSSLHSWRTLLPVSRITLSFRKSSVDYTHWMETDKQGKALSFQEAANLFCSRDGNHVIFAQFWSSTNIVLSDDLWNFYFSANSIYIIRCKYNRSINYISFCIFLINFWYYLLPLP